MSLFKKKIKFETKFKINEFVSFHYNNDLKHGIINDIRKENDIIYYDIKVGGEATWLCKNVEEKNIIKPDIDGVIHKK